MSQEVQLLLLIVLAIVVLLVLIMKFKLHAFISLLLVSMLVGVFAGMPLSGIMKAIQKGMGGTLGFIAIVVGLGAMFGRMLEISGGIERLTQTLIQKFGKEKTPWAMMVSGFIISVPVFFDVGFIILVPLVYSLAKDTKKSLLVFGIPLLAGLAVTHSFVPPTPGPVAVAQLVDADLGKVILFGLIVGVPAAIIAGPIFGNYIGKKIHVEVPEYMESDKSLQKTDYQNLPGFATIATLIAIPIVLILANTTATTFLPEGDSLRDFLSFIGHPFAALTIATILSFVILGKFKGLTKDEVNSVASASLAPTGLIILVTGAGGVFKQILIDSGIGKMLASNFAGSGLSPLILAFVLAIVVRVAAGSATVAMMTAGGIIAPIVAGMDVEPALIVLAIASGATAFSHVNDSGFWLVNRYFGLSEKDTLKSWTVMETIIGFVGIGGVLLLSIFV